MKISITFCLLACAFAAPDSTNLPKSIFARQLLGPNTPPTLTDFQNLYTALSNKFVNPQNIPKYVRMSFHDLLNYNGAGSTGAQGCIIDDQRVANFAENRGLGDFAKALKSFVQKEFPTIKFSSGDIVSLAGKVAVEKAFPCIKIKWSFGRKPCTGQEQELGPSALINTLANMKPFLTRYGLSSTEMATLTSGAHGVAGSLNTKKNSEIHDFRLATVTVSSGVGFIRESITRVWRLKHKNWYEDSNSSGSPKPGRFFTDLLFLPTTLRRVKDIGHVDESAELKQVEKTLLGYNDASFNKAFGDVFAKMLLIGTQGTNLTPFSGGSATC